MRLRGVIIVESLLADIGWLQGPYVAYVEKMTSCENGSTDGSWSMNSHVSHFNRYKPYEKQILSGNFTLNSSLDDTVWVNLRMDIRANNQWKPNAFVLKIQNACSTFRSNFRGVFNVVFKGVPQNNPCSVPTVRLRSQYRECEAWSRQFLARTIGIVYLRRPSSPKFKWGWSIWDLHLQWPCGLELFQRPCFPVWLLPRHLQRGKKGLKDFQSLPSRRNAIYSQVRHIIWKLCQISH